MKQLLSLAFLGLCTLSFADQHFSTDGGSSPLPDAFGDMYGSGIVGAFYNFGPDYWALGGSWNTGEFDFRIGINCDWTFNPSTDGAITSIDYDADYRQYHAFRAPNLILLQDGKTFYGSLPATSDQTSFWLHGSGNMVQDSFFELLPAVGSWDLNSHPNFGPGGSEIEFYVSLALYSTTNLGNGSEAFDYDNVNIHLNTVPEPASTAAIGLGLGVLAVRRRRKSQRPVNSL